MQTDYVGNIDCSSYGNHERIGFSVSGVWGGTGSVKGQGPGFQESSVIWVS